MPAHPVVETGNVERILITASENYSQAVG